MLTWLTAQGLPDSAIQLISGHSSNKSLEVYQHLSLAQVESSYQKVTKDVGSAKRDPAAKLKRDFPEELTADARGFKKRAVRVLRRELPPGRGRPTDPQLDAAARMVDERKPIRDVVRWFFPDYDRMDTVGRYLTAKGLRAALARRTKRPLPAVSA